MNIALDASSTLRNLRKKLNNWSAYGWVKINKSGNYGANKSWQICVRLSNGTRRTLKCFTLNAFQIQSQNVSHTYAFAFSLSISHSSTSRNNVYAHSRVVFVVFVIFVYQKFCICIYLYVCVYYYLCACVRMYVCV